MTNPPRRGYRALPLLGAALLPGCGEVTEPVAKVQPSLVLITLDTTRADRIGAYGHATAETPTIDALAREGVRFERAYSTVPLTTPAHSSILSGLWPTRHGVHTNGDAILADPVQTLAEVLKAEGYATGASVSAFVTTRVWNLDQGFDAYFDDVSARPGAHGRWGRERPADATVDDAIGWVAQQEGPFFLWVHLYDPHHPHVAPAEFMARHPDPYDAEIAFVDAQLARLRAEVDRKAGDAGAAWIVVADHGEAFGMEHGEDSHGLFLFDPTMRVPFVARPPVALSTPVVVEDTTVSVVDVMPTALGMLGIASPTDLDGVDLSGAATGAVPPRAPVFMEAYTVEQRFGYHPELAVAERDLKLMATPDARLYDVSADPGEIENLLSTRPDDAARLRKALDAIEARAVDIVAETQDPAVLEQLEALGYVGAGGSFGGERSEVDAKTRVATIQRLDRTRALGADPAAIQEVERLYREILAEEPQLGEARSGLAKTLQKLGRLEEALETYRTAIENEPDSVVLRASYANCLAAAGLKEEGLAEMEGILLKIPTDDIARVGVLKMLSDLGRHEEALARATVWLAEDPNDPTMQAHAGTLMVRLGQDEEGSRLLVESLGDGIPRMFVHRMLANVAIRQKRWSDARDHLQEELAFFPSEAEARRSLGDVLMAMEDWDEAAAEFAWIVERTPTDVAARHSWAQAVFNVADYEESARILAPALEQSPNDPYVLLLHANLLEKQGKKDEAKKVFERAKAALKQKPR